MRRTLKLSCGCIQVVRSNGKLGRYEPCGGPRGCIANPSPWVTLWQRIQNALESDSTHGDKLPGPFVCPTCSETCECIRCDLPGALDSYLTCPVHGGALRSKE